MVGLLVKAIQQSYNVVLNYFKTKDIDKTRLLRYIFINLVPLKDVLLKAFGAEIALSDRLFHLGHHYHKIFRTLSYEITYYDK